MITKLCLLTVLLALADAARILVYFPMASRSHSILGHAVARHLLDDGHEVVHITSFPKDKPVPRLKEINTSHLGKMLQNFDPEPFKLKNIIGQPNIGLSPFFLLLTHDMTQRMLEDETLVKLFSDPNEKFDAVVLEWFFSDVIAGLASVLDCPLIWFGSTEAHWQVLRLMDEIPNPSYNADILSEARPPMAFVDRVAELWNLVRRWCMIEFWLKPKQTELYNRVFSPIAAARGVALAPLEESMFSGSFMFLNSHPSFGTPFRLPQNVKYVGGYHVEEQVPALPEEIKKLMDNSKHGVVYFSMGSNLQSNDMSDEMKASILKTFGELQQDVLWKFEGDLEGVPKNVKLLKWAPQQSILAHPNLKAFITHGGQLSTTEAVHYGVPLIGIPMLGDQHVNMRSVEAKGFGIKLTMAEDIADQMRVALKEVLGKPDYAKKAKEISQIYHDRPTKPGEELKHWVNHVISTGGAKHLASYALIVPWYQKMYLDLFALIFAVLYLLVAVVKKCFRKGQAAKKLKKK